jgi:hypothetical protein
MKCFKGFFIVGKIVTRKEDKRMQVSEMISVSNYWLKIDTYGTVHSGWWVQPFSENNSTLLNSNVKKITTTERNHDWKARSRQDTGQIFASLLCTTAYLEPD